VVLDHFLIGDGSRDGSRTRQRVVAKNATFPEMLEKAGYEEWTRIESLHRVREIFQRVLGPGRLGISREGFFQAAHRLMESEEGGRAGEVVKDGR
jgi:hypothetical protein